MWFHRLDAGTVTAPRLQWMSKEPAGERPRPLSRVKDKPKTGPVDFLKALSVFSCPTAARKTED